MQPSARLRPRLSTPCADPVSGCRNDPAEHHSRLQVGESSIVAERLHCAASSRVGSNRGSGISVGFQEREDRQGERGGLPCGLRRADDVFAGENERDASQLNRRGLGVPRRLHATQHIVRKSK